MSYLQRALDLRDTIDQTEWFLREYAPRLWCGQQDAIGDKIDAMEREERVMTFLAELFEQEPVLRRYRLRDDTLEHLRLAVERGVPRDSWTVHPERYLP